MPFFLCWQYSSRDSLYRCHFQFDSRAFSNPIKLPPRLLGVPRMRQLRVNNRSCTVPTYFDEQIKVCYGGYSESIEDKADFAPSHRTYSSADAWRYQNVLELDANTHNGILAAYRDVPRVTVNRLNPKQLHIRSTVY